uniref:hypothetical protein n=1 Tax=Nonomuraea pusilla TaxID=46177 RepID=UPI001F2F76CA|nr:hypothetical protein [Nonomuraea pusilla]
MARAESPVFSSGRGARQYILTTFLLSYATGGSVGESEQLILNGLSVAAFVELVATLGIAWMGGRFGSRKVTVWFLAATALPAVPQFAVLGSHNTFLICLMRLATSGTYGPMAAILAEMFPPQAVALLVGAGLRDGAAAAGGRGHRLPEARTSTWTLPLEQLRSWLEMAGDTYLRAGVTTVCDPQVSRRELLVYRSAWDAGTLPVRTVVMPLSHMLDELTSIGLAGPFGDDRLRFGAGRAA